MAQSQQQQQQASSHLGQVAKRHGGEEANAPNGTNGNTILTDQRTASPGAGQVRGGNGVALPDPPETAKHPVTDTLHGDTITDDYRWLEKQQDPETRSWIHEQNDYTDNYLQQVTIRPEIKAELTKLERVDSYSTPAKRGNLYFFKKRLADENQGSIYLRHGVGGGDERLVDARPALQPALLRRADFAGQDGLVLRGVSSLGHAGVLACLRHGSVRGQDDLRQGVQGRAAGRTGPDRGEHVG
jgi:prolyl oligopeptidase